MPHYKRPPITEAVVEVRFEAGVPLSSIERLRNRLLEFYPAPVQSIYTANVELVERGSRVIEQQIDGFRLTAGDGTGIISIGQRFIGTSRLAPYEGWESFNATARRNWELWKRQIGWQRIVRVGIRYINRIDVPMQGPALSIEDYLNFSLRQPPIQLPPLQTYAINTSRPLGKDDCTLILNSGLVPSPLVNTVSLLLDIDVAREVDAPQNDKALWEFVERARQYKNEIFEACITDRTRELFDR
jgi:uncharacterized protein (TIGR04255 family)